MTAGPGSGSAMGLRGACGGAGGLRQAGDGLKSASECIPDRAPQNSFLPPINERGSLAPVPRLPARCPRPAT